MNRREHWQQVFANKQVAQMSWSQLATDTTYDTFKRLKLPHSAHIVEAGCGVSQWSVQALLDGYQHLTLVDISEQALQQLQQIHRDNSVANRQCQYLNIDLSSTLDWQKQVNKPVDCWIDRAVFHFMTKEKQKLNYIDNVCASLQSKGYWILATFSENGPDKCSNLPVQKYSDAALNHFLQSTKFTPFQCIAHWQQLHTTPWGTPQSFNWWVLQRQ